MNKTIIESNASPKAIGPYSQAVRVQNMLFASGMLPVDAKSGEIVQGGIQQQSVKVMENIKALLQSAGLSMKNIVKTTIFLKNMDDFSIVNTTYAQFFEKDYPARSTVEVARLPKDVLIEIECIAYYDA